MLSKFSIIDVLKCDASGRFCVDECPGAGNGYLYHQKKYSENNSDNKKTSKETRKSKKNMPFLQ